MKPSVYSSRGMSVVEGLMALAIVSVVALAAVTAIRALSKDTRYFGESCRLYNISVLQRIRNIGVASDIANFIPLLSDRTILSSGVPYGPILGQTPQQRWPNVPILGQGPTPTLLNSLLISGYMNVLQGIYNSDASFCNSHQPFPPGSEIVISPPADDYSFKLGPNRTRIKITPYDTTTGALVTGCPRPIYPIPAGKFLDTEVSSAFYDAGNVEDRKVQHPNGARSNVGFAVSVRTEYEIEPGKNESCITEERFRYHTDTGSDAAPPIPLITMTSSALTDLDLAPCTARSLNTYTINIDVPTTAEPGVVLLCRNKSVLPTAAAPITVGTYTPGAKYPVVCNGAPGNQVAFATGAVHTYYPPKIPDSYYPTLTPDYIGLLYDTSVYGENKWVPCDQMPLCDVLPSPVRKGGRFPTKNSSYGYELTYNNLESGCRVRFEVVALDTAGNSSAPYQTPSIGNNGPLRIYSQDGAGVNVGSWDVPTPRCTNFCGDWPNIYFTCGGCP